MGWTSLSLLLFLLSECLEFFSIPSVEALSKEVAHNHRQDNPETKNILPVLLKGFFKQVQKPKVDIPPGAVRVSIVRVVRIYKGSEAINGAGAIVCHCLFVSSEVVEGRVAAYIEIPANLLLLNATVIFILTSQ